MFLSTGPIRPFLQRVVLREHHLAVFLRRQHLVKAFATTSETHTTTTTPPRVVVLGSGWGGFNLVR
jgi:hypothetical protein